MIIKLKEEKNMAFETFLFLVLIFTPMVFGQTFTDPPLVLSDAATDYYTTVDFSQSVSQKDIQM